MSKQMFNIDTSFCDMVISEMKCLAFIFCWQLVTRLWRKNANQTGCPPQKREVFPSRWRFNVKTASAAVAATKGKMAKLSQLDVHEIDEFEEI